MDGPTPAIGLSTATLIVTGMRGVPRYALVHSYVDCVTGAGGLPILLPNVAPETSASYLSRIDGLLLTGGLDVDPYAYGQEPKPNLGKLDQARDHFEIELVRGAHGAGIPILAICRGVQLLNVAFGGTLLQDIHEEVPHPLRHEQDDVRQDAMSHGVEIVAGTHLHEIARATRVRVNTFHHQAVSRPAEGFRVTARAPDGVVEGLEDPEHPFCVGVQWHPERRPEDPLTQSLFRHFVDAARAVAHAGAATRAGAGDGQG